jgi:hypothetical protein
MQRKNDSLNAHKIQEIYSDVYDSIEFQVTTATTDYNVKTTQATSFKNAPIAHSIVIRTDQTVTVKLNASTNTAFTVSRGEGSFTITRNMGIEVTNLFITNVSGNTANIKIFLAP